jgi:hypothetical protein
VSSLQCLECPQRLGLRPLRDDLIASPGRALVEDLGLAGREGVVVRRLEQPVDDEVIGSRAGSEDGPQGLELLSLFVRHGEFSMKMTAWPEEFAYGIGLKKCDGLLIPWEMTSFGEQPNHTGRR